MRLPRGGAKELFQSDSTRPFEQVENLGRFASAAGRRRLLGPSGLAGPFRLGRCAGGALFRHTCDLGRRSAALGSRRGRLGLRRRNLGASLRYTCLLYRRGAFANRRCRPVFRLFWLSRGSHSKFSFRGNRRVTTLITQPGRTSKLIVEEPFKKQTLAMPMGLTRDFPQLQLRGEGGFASGQKQKVLLDWRCQLRQNHDL